jgi:two-component system, response regulator YesN
MAILSKRILSEVGKLCRREYGIRPFFMDLSGRTQNPPDVLSVLSSTRRKRNYALQESINLGEPYFFEAAPSIATWLIVLEDRKMVHGALIGGEVIVEERVGTNGENVDYLVAQGMSRHAAGAFFRGLQTWPESRTREAGKFLQETFYQVSGWKPELMKENRLKNLQKQQINEAIEDQRKYGKNAIYAFEKERVLLANIRAGDRLGARRILNEMLAIIYLSSPQLVVLRARAVELMSCLTRAAIEDNPLMEPLIERNHAWTERLIRARSFEDISQELMAALDDFIDGIYLHGLNRSNTRVRKAIDYVSRNFAQKVRLQDVATEAGVSVSRLSHLVKEFTGKTMLQIIQQVRARHAQQLLERSAKSCAEIAYETGFGDQSYFIKHFKRLTGTTPASYRRSRRA